MMRRTAVAVALLALPATGGAQEKISQSRPAAADGVVQIENPSGSIRVIGWDRAEVAVAGTLGHGADAVDLRGDKRRTHVEVESDNPHGHNTDLEVRVPAGSDVVIESYAASISVSDVRGTLSAETVNGDIQVTNGGREVQAETVNGSVTVSSRGGRVRAESVNGSVSVRGAAGEIDASTVNGPLTVTGETFERARLETVNGRILFDASLEARGVLEAESVSGAVELVLPSNIAADFTISTFSGDIRNELGPPARKPGLHLPGKELTFSTGGGGANVSVETLSGGIVLRRK